MKKIWFVISLVSIVLITVISILIITNNKQQVTMPMTIMSTQSAKAFSGVTLHENSIENNWVYVTNNAGEKINVPVKVVEPNTIEIDRLQAGSYKLHVQKQALKKNNMFTRNQVVDFEVIEKLATIKSKKELEAYFEKLAKLNKSNSGNELFGVEESADTAKLDSSGSSHSSTNNQVEGIEEGDVAVTDGEVIYTVSGSNVFLIDAKNPASLKQLAAIRLKEQAYVEQLILHNNYLIISYSDYIEQNKKANIFMKATQKSGFMTYRIRKNRNLFESMVMKGIV